MFPATIQTHVFTTTVTKATSWLEIHTECVVMMAHGTRKHLFVNVSVLFDSWVLTTAESGLPDYVDRVEK